MKNLVIVGAIIIVAIIAILPTLKNNSIDIDILLEQSIKENKLLLLELSSTTCSTCRRMQPYLQQIEEEYADKIIIKTIDIVAKTDIAKRFKVNAIPTQIFIDRKGNEYFKHVGYMTKNELLEIFRQKGL